MPKIICGSLDCKYNNNNCECTFNGIVSFTENGVHTKYSGFQTFLKCKRYEQSEQSKKVNERSIQFLERREHAINHRPELGGKNEKRV